MAPPTSVVLGRHMEGVKWLIWYKLKEEKAMLRTSAEASELSGGLSR